MFSASWSLNAAAGFLFGLRMCVGFDGASGSSPTNTPFSSLLFCASRFI
jgi:hypothetical protein